MYKANRILNMYITDRGFKKDKHTFREKKFNLKNKL